MLLPSSILNFSELLLVWTKTAFAWDVLKVKALPTHFVPAYCVALLLSCEQKTTHSKISLPYWKKWKCHSSFMRSYMVTLWILYFPQIYYAISLDFPEDAHEVDITPSMKTGFTSGQQQFPAGTKFVGSWGHLFFVFVGTSLLWHLSTPWSLSMQQCQEGLTTKLFCLAIRPPWAGFPPTGLHHYNFYWSTAVFKFWSKLEFNLILNNV